MPSRRIKFRFHESSVLCQFTTCVTTGRTNVSTKSSDLFVCNQDSFMCVTRLIHVCGSLTSRFTYSPSFDAVFWHAVKANLDSSIHQNYIDLPPAWPLSTKCVTDTTHRRNFNFNLNKNEVGTSTAVSDLTEYDSEVPTSPFHWTSNQKERHKLETYTGLAVACVWIDSFTRAAWRIPVFAHT